ncbi:MAG: undecaprenyldiphospho-muramoylpentapeptide beta-N-acetylglucosaminyltransferase [Campylobacterota bacterium]|nr:undecaprenyldiphospho-muramoylpentapeptide beta-N-acetylglucosaminyltransferase [Campylobacterota bacterium]
MQNGKTVLITGGGTGGHLSVAKTFIDEFYERGYRVLFIGSLKGADKKWFENDENIYKSFFMDTYGVVNQNSFGKIKSLYKIIKAVVKSINIIKKYDVIKVISVGGFSAAPASFAAISSGIDFYIHEQNSIMGKLNKTTSKMAKEVFSSYLESSKVKDYPINKKFFNHSRVRKEIKTIIFLGGSQGAKEINDFALNVASKLKEKNINIIHQTGSNDFQRVKDEYQKLKIEVDLFDFSDDIISKMDKADFAVSRSGASTLWELVAIGIPTLFIPYPYAASNHQYFNAKYLVDNNLAFLNDKDKIEDILDINLEEKSQKLINLISPNSVSNMVDMILV